MNIQVQQTIHIQMIKIGALSNSSVLQIGTAGIITPSSHLYNTGGFKEAAQAALPTLPEETLPEAFTLPSVVPL